MASIDFPISRSPAKFQEFLTKLQSVGTPDKIGTAYPASIGFGSSHARGFPLVLKNVGLLDSSGAPTDVYKRGLRGGHAGRAVVGAAIQQAYKPMFAVYPDAAAQADGDLVTFVKSNSSLDDDNARLVVRTFKVLSEFADFSGAAPSDHDTDDDDNAGNKVKTPRQRRAKSSSEVVINVNIALSVDATSDPAVYDAFFAAMAKHLGGLTDGA